MHVSESPPFTRIALRPSKPKRWALLIPCVLLSAVALTPTNATEAGAAAKKKSRVKIITVPPTISKKYLLTVDGRVSMTGGDEVDEATLSVPVISISTVRVPNQPVVHFGTGNGRVVEHLSVIGKNCDMRGTVSFTILIGPAREPVDRSTTGEDDLGPLTGPPATVPTGSVAFSVNGVAVGLAALAKPGASLHDLGGIQQRMCTLSTDPLFETPLSLAGSPVTLALGLANDPPLVFPATGGTIVRRQELVEMTYFFTYKLKRA